MKTMDTVRVNAYAKLNLTLDVAGKKDGYHLIDSLMTSVDLCDRITVRRRKDKLVRVFLRGASIPPEEEITLRAGEAFAERFATCGADVSVSKNIPIGAGMGGSSADAAGVIAGMGRLYGVTDRDALFALAGELASDAPFQLEGGLARVTGRGETVQPLGFSEMYFLVLVPRTRVSTAQAYAAFDERGDKGSCRTQLAAERLAAGMTEWAAECFGNDLFPAACSLAPEIRKAYFDLKVLSPYGASMTGSGSAVFGCFAEEELCKWAKSRYRGKCRALIVKSVRRNELGGIGE